MSLVLAVTAPVLAVVAAVLAIRLGLLVTTVDGTSMEPALRPGDRVLVRRTRRVRPGVLVVFEYPDLPSGKVPPPGRDRQYLIKRVVAVPGDRLPAAWADPDVQGIAGAVVPPGSLVVLGDNRAASWDSRHYGFLPRARVVGVAVRRFGSEGGGTGRVAEGGGAGHVGAGGHGAPQAGLADGGRGTGSSRYAAAWRRKDSA
ncbi:S26 family signal peptidase [Actinoallomurus spadix]|uniref:signal peptidase I n=1 Tax=Actinoallomurus spadix TaxID=79912 RepID=A0ABN0VZ05_9ACTN|nr:S26 family signal peptidase [Actinoallomurus spadix]MCO5988049.1 S26 family signal peptidase [Actinoallomurus spadix]